jgi:branched-subunit amino acid ABC-type transport system permease component
MNATGNFWLSLVLAPLAIALLGGIVEKTMVSRLYGKDIPSTLFLTFGLSMVFSNAVLLIWAALLNQATSLFQRLHKPGMCT